MKNIAKCLREQFPADDLYLLLAKRNTGSFTYDGIERGGERVCAEIEEELQNIAQKGGKITKLSIIGYSLGGLVSRYAVGLLEAKGVLDKVECMVRDGQVPSCRAWIILSILTLLSFRTLRRLRLPISGYGRP